MNDELPPWLARWATWNVDRNGAYVPLWAERLGWWLFHILKRLAIALHEDA